MGFIILAAGFYFWLLLVANTTGAWRAFWATLPLWGPFAFYVTYILLERFIPAEGLPVGPVVATGALLAIVIPFACFVVRHIFRVLSGETRAHG
jgi:hypothetical protein